MSKRIKVILGFIISAICLYFVLKDFQFKTLLEIFQQLRWKWVLMALAVYLTAHFLRALRWKIIIPSYVPISIKNVFWLILFGFLLNNILPARAGEFARAYALKKDFKLDFPVGLSSIFLERLFDFLTIGFLLLIGLNYINSPYVNPKVVFGGAAGALIILGFMVSIKFDEEKYDPKSILGKAVHLLGQFKSGIKALQSPRKIMIVALLSGSIMFIELVNLFLLSRAVGAYLELKHILVLFLGIVAGVAVPASPGSVGTFEIFGQKTLEMLGVASVQSLAFVIFIHFYYFSINSILGMVYLFKFGNPSLAPERTDLKL